MGDLSYCMCERVWFDCHATTDYIIHLLIGKAFSPAIPWHPRFFLDWNSTYTRYISPGTSIRHQVYVFMLVCTERKVLTVIFYQVSLSRAYGRIRSRVDFVVNVSVQCTIPSTYDTIPGIDNRSRIPSTWDMIWHDILCSVAFVFTLSVYCTTLAAKIIPVSTLILISNEHYMV